MSHPWKGAIIFLLFIGRRLQRPEGGGGGDKTGQNGTERDGTGWKFYGWDTGDNETVPWELESA